MKIILGLSFVFGTLFGCAGTKKTDAPANETLKSNTNSSPSQKDIPTKSETITLKDQKARAILTAIVYNPEVGNKTYLAAFSPNLEKTDENLFFISLQLLEKYYGKERGLMDIKDVTTKQFELGTFICWGIYNPKQEFCIAPSKTEGEGKRVKIDGAVFFVK